MVATVNASTSSGVIVTSDTSGVLQLQTASTTAVTIDTSQNVGVGVTPSAWGSGYKALQVFGGSVMANTTYLQVGANNYFNGTNDIYINTGYAVQYQQNLGKHIWLTAPSGTAGNAITFTQAMTLDASGNLGIGTSSPSAKLDVSGGSLRINEDGAGTHVLSLRSFYAGVAPAINVLTNDPLLFLTNNTEQMRLTSTGLGIGTSSVQEKLTVAGAGLFQGALSAYRTSGVGLDYFSNTARFWSFGPNTSTASGMTFNNVSSNGSVSQTLTYDSAGNLGLGVTPSAWLSTTKVAQIGQGAVLFGRTASNQVQFGSNFYIDTSAVTRYINTDFASKYVQDSGQHQFFTAASGTGGAALASFTQAMTLNASGQLGIGTTSPASALDVQAAQTVLGLTSTTGTNAVYTAYKNNSGSTAFYIGIDNSTGSNFTGTGYAPFLWSQNAYPIIFGTSNGERMRIDSSGNLLVGVTSGTSNQIDKNIQNEYSLYVRNTATANTYGIKSSFPNVSPNGAGNQFLICSDSSANRLIIYSNGGIANYSANNVNLSDRREKTNFAPSKSYLNVICAIPVQTFNYVDQNRKTDDGLTLGVVAQDVQAVAPELVMESNWADKGQEPKMRLSIYQTDLQYALMKCIQELSAQVTELKAEVQALKGA
jgi:hypothetical protein